MEPRELVKRWVDAFNRADAAELATFYAEDATNHQVVRNPVVGRDAIRAMFASEFAQLQSSIASQIDTLIARVAEYMDTAIIDATFGPL